MSNIYSAKDGHSNATHDELQHFITQVSKVLVYNPHRKDKVDVVVKTLRINLNQHFPEFKDMSDRQVCEWMRHCYKRFMDDKNSPAQHWLLDGGADGKTGDKHIINHGCTLDFKAILATGKYKHTGKESDCLTHADLKAAAMAWADSNAVPKTWIDQVMSMKGVQFAHIVARSGVDGGGIAIKDLSLRGWVKVKSNLIDEESDEPAKPDLHERAGIGDMWLRIMRKLERIAETQRTLAEAMIQFSERLDGQDVKLSDIQSGLVDVENSILNVQSTLDTHQG